MNNDSLNYYKVLGINNDVSKHEIREAYKKMALSFHPDKNKKDTNKEFQQISEAYQVLYDDELRIKYDKNNEDNYIDIDIDFTNPINLFRDLFPEYISNHDLSNLLNKLEDTNITFSDIFDYLVDIYKKQKTIKKNIYVDVNYHLSDHYNNIFFKDVFIETSLDNEERQFKYQIDTRINKHLFIERVEFKESVYQIMININTKAIQSDKFKILGDSNLLYTENISYNDYNNGLVMPIDLFGYPINIKLENINQSFLLYKLSGLGLPYSGSKRGDLYIKMNINVDLDCINNNNLSSSCSSIKADMVNFF